jgi:cell division septation protein DedD
MKIHCMALLAALAIANPVASAAQAPPTLDRVEELTRDGRAEEARTELLAWWSESAAKASRRDVQRGLWLRGRLTVDPAQAELDFRRLVIEFPGGAFSDQALFRLAQIAYASGDSLAAVEQVARLGREYPTSPVRREADGWLATAGPVPAARGAGQPSTTSPAGSGASASRQAAPSGAAAPSGGTDGTPSQGNFTAQLGAFSTFERAEALRRRVVAGGIDARIVTIPGSDLVRVRAGRFDSAEGVDAILRRLQDLGVAGALARDAHLEQRVVR